jgi:hypothetical protein
MGSSGTVNAGTRPDRTTPLVEVLAAGVPASDRSRVPVAVPPQLAAAFHDALDHWDLARLRRTLQAAGLPDAVVKPLHRIAHAAQLLLELDLEDLDHPPRVEVGLRDELLAVALPQQPSASPRGLLASMLPTASLLLDVIEIRYEQRDAARLLAGVHLVGEIMPILAWEDVLGHGADPTQLLRLTAGSLWGTDGCPTTGPGASAARRLPTAVRDASAWQQYLERSWSSLGAQLADCAGCRLSCRVGQLADDRRAALVARHALCRTFARSPLMGLRHGSVVGHALAVPSREEVDRAWLATRGQLARLHSAVDAADGHPLAGMRAAVSAVAGTAVPTTSVLRTVERELRACVADSGAL